MTDSLQRVADLYTQSLRDHGRSSKGVGWRDDESHALRFAKLCTLLANDEAPVTVNDLGCGYGALYSYLTGSLGRRVERFYGYDISDDMLAMARESVQAPGVEFVHSDRILHEVEYSFASGIFNVRFDTPEPDWTAYVHRVLDDLHEHSTRGFAFNVLTTCVDYREDHLYYADPAAYLDHCMGRFGRHVALLHDYPLYEWTMVVRKL